ncbi:MAG: hypothetical protein ACREHC_05950 [Candidatus Levyibacteriota bacterium]
MKQMLRKHIYLFLLLLFVLFLIPYTAHSYILKTNGNAKLASPSPSVSIQDNSDPSPIISLTANETPLSANPEDRLVDLIQHRRPLSQSDIAAKKKIVASLPSTDNAGNIYHSSNINIDYTESVDLFQVEILTTAVDSAEQEAVNYFIQQGMSQQGICNLPVSFYLNFEIKKNIPTTTPFSPLAPGC